MDHEAGEWSPYWVTLSLLDLAARHWASFDGWCRDIDPWELPAHRMLSFIYHWATEGAEESQLQKFDRRLWMPPPGVEATEGPWSREAEMSAFRGLASQLHVKTTGEPDEE